ncbi:NAD(P)-binding domain-containing protein [Bradyrhizobium sp. HKCCYLS20291]|uniref:NAD(P)-binding domain-containing protein n=1 Tax=Bradyrhizobium sp. HKCCYLS20291 TaxID=3420766 RepID=UPI003EBFB360
MSITELSRRVRRELTYLGYPSREWTCARTLDGVPAVDVLIVGGGQSGLGTAFGLQREQITNIRIIDRNPRGREGPWRRFARMTTLRTPKDVDGIDFGIPSLTARAWYEAQFGRDAWERMQRLPQEVWRDYLDWYRDVLGLNVENEVELMSVEPSGDLLVAHLLRAGRTERVPARKIVLATGFDGSGRPRLPQALIANLSKQHYAHSSDEIDFSRLRGKRIGILGVGASAFDNAGTALEAGAARVDLCFRRAAIPRVNPLIWMNFAGLLGYFGDLPDLERWRFMRHILEDLPVPPTQESVWRCRRHAQFAWHGDSQWSAARPGADGVEVTANGRTFQFDFIIFATGFDTDLTARPELGPIVDHIALWRDRFEPPAGERSELLGRHPYLGPAFEFTERTPGAAPFVRRLHQFTFGAMPSQGLTGAAIPGLKRGLRRLVQGLARDLFCEDAAHYYEDLRAYAQPELETLDTEFDWLTNLGTQAMQPNSLLQEFTREILATLGDEAARQDHPAGLMTRRRAPIKPVALPVKSKKKPTKPRLRAK